MRIGSDWPWNEIINSIQSHHLLLCGGFTVNNGAHNECSILLNVQFIIRSEEKIRNNLFIQQFMRLRAPRPYSIFPNAGLVIVIVIA